MQRRILQEHDRLGVADRTISDHRQRLRDAELEGIDILSTLQRERRVVAKAVSRELGLSEDTIRRDLRELAEAGLLQRVHGALPASPALADLAGRQKIGLDGKTAIARRATRLVRPGQVVFIDGGTAAALLARHPLHDLKATVVTHSPNVAVELAGHEAIDIILIGGPLFRHSMVATGAEAAEAIARIRADLYFMGVTGVHPEVKLTTGNPEEAAIKRLLIRQAAETVVLASREKLGAASPCLVAPLPEIDMLVVEAALPEELLAPFRRQGVTVIPA